MADPLSRHWSQFRVAPTPILSDRSVRNSLTKRPVITHCGHQEEAALRSAPANSARVRTPLGAASATFALKAGLWLRSFLRVIFCSCSFEDRTAEVSTYALSDPVAPADGVHRSFTSSRRDPVLYAVAPNSCWCR